MAQRVRAATLAATARRAVAACGGEPLVRAALADRDGGRSRSSAPSALWICGVGKAVGAMAAGALAALPSARLGPLIGKHPHPGLPVIEAGHPLPDERSARATTAMLAFLARRSTDEEVILLLSGGASSLLGGPRPGLSLDAVRSATDGLLRSGAPIDAINTVRRHLGAALGGRLALATPAALTTLALSDVIGDAPHAIGSGPTVADASTFADALAIANAWGIRGEASDFLARGSAGGQDAPDENPASGDPRLGRSTLRLLATPSTLRAAAAEEVRAAGLTPRVQPGLVEGAVEALAERYTSVLPSLAPGEVLVSVGEPTVTVRGAGLGGRAQQLALAIARAISGTPASFVALGSDGSDGPTDAAGAFVDGETWSRALALGLDPAAALARFDAHPLLDAASALLRTGPTGTNLLDLHLLSAF